MDFSGVWETRDSNRVRVERYGNGWTGVLQHKDGEKVVIVWDRDGNAYVGGFIAPGNRRRELDLVERVRDGELEGTPVKRS